MAKQLVYYEHRYDYRASTDTCGQCALSGYLGGQAPGAGRVVDGSGGAEPATVLQSRAVGLVPDTPSPDNTLSGPEFCLFTRTTSLCGSRRASGTGGCPGVGELKHVRHKNGAQRPHPSGAAFRRFADDEVGSAETPVHRALPLTRLRYPTRFFHPAPVLHTRVDIPVFQLRGFCQVIGVTGSYWFGFRPMGTLGRPIMTRAIDSRFFYPSDSDL